MSCRRRTKDIADLSDRQVKRLVTKSVKDAEYDRGQQSHNLSIITSKGPPTTVPSVHLPSPAPAVILPTVNPALSIDPNTAVPDLNHATGFYDQFFEDCTLQSAQSTVSGCDQSNVGHGQCSDGAVCDIDRSFVGAVDSDETFKEYFITCEVCERCSMCSCLLSCGECCHSSVGSDCVHCYDCCEDWLSLTKDDTDVLLETDSDDSSGNDEVTLADDLGTWAFNAGVSHTKLRELLLILRKHHPEDNLPIDARTLLHTARSISIKELKPGYYWHNSLKNHLLKQFCGFKEEHMIKLIFNVDGLPISTSSGSSLWPILCSATTANTPSEDEVFLCGVYHGYSKPDSSNSYLEELIEELKDLISNRLDVGGKHFDVCLWCFVCDGPAKAFVLNIKNFNGYCSCTKCFQQGKMIGNRMCFPDVDFRERTDESFINREQPGHHLDHQPDSIVLAIPGCKPVSSFVLDPMHLLYLGTMKKLLLSWTIGPLNVRMGKVLFTEISALLVKFMRFIPVEFVRKTRSLEELRRYKATELRLVLLYVGPVVFRKLSAAIYENFLCLHFAVRLLSSSDTCIEYNEYAGELMKLFVTNFKVIYGEQYVSHNIHGCLHINKDVLNYGPLDYFSAFRFENFLQKLKKLIRKGNQPLQQIAKRYSEMDAVREKKCDAGKKDGFQKEHSRGPVVPGCGYPQYSVFMWKGFELNVRREADCCVTLKDGSVVVSRNVAYHSDKKCFVLIGSSYMHREDLYTYPCPSSSAGSFKVHGLSALKYWPVEMISRKCIRLPYSDSSTAILPILHKEKCKF